jgi:hypothetical protein
MIKIQVGNLQQQSVFAHPQQMKPSNFQNHKMEMLKIFLFVNEALVN